MPVKTKVPYCRTHLAGAPKSKKCTKCGKRKKLEGFGSHKGIKSGINPACKACVAIRGAAWYVANKLRRRTKSLAYYRANKKRILRVSKRYRIAHKAAIARRSAEYNRSNADKIRARHAKYYQENKHRMRAARRAYAEKNKDRKAAYDVVYRAQNRDRQAALQRVRWANPPLRAYSNARRRLYHVINGRSGYGI